jgi:hypothetical protein
MFVDLIVDIEYMWFWGLGFGKWAGEKGRCVRALLLLLLPCADWCLGLRHWRRECALGFNRVW